MTGLAFSFPAGRFHATPWGRHVNEAAPEWPPSPWRIIRAIVATWKRKLDGEMACHFAIVEKMIQKLADPPVFALPSASIGHTRHFMPWFKKGPGDRTLIFDGFVSVDKHRPLFCLWPNAELKGDERRALDAVISCMVFLGRSESWVEARVLTEEEAARTMAVVNCMPFEENYDRTKYDTVRVLCANPVTAFQSTHECDRSEGRGKSRNKNTTPLYDPDWNLCMETSELHKKRLSDPPGSEWITYLRRKDCFAADPISKKISVLRPRPTMARFAVDGIVLPLMEDTLRIAETARRTSMGVFRRIEEKRLYQGARPDDAPPIRSEAFSGKDENGNPLKGHRHAYYLPTDEDGDGRIDHITIVADMGFNQGEVLALDRMNLLRRDDGDPLNLMLLALGQASDTLAPKVTGPSRVWDSVTPFIATRYPKRRGRKRDPVTLLGIDNQHAFARQVLIEEIQRRFPDFSAGIEVEYLNEEQRCGARRLRPIQFKRFRQKRGDDGGRRASGVFRIIFPEPVSGPLCLGHSSHFGMGMFQPAPEVEL